jgi:hypothetical protein
MIGDPPWDVAFYRKSDRYEREFDTQGTKANTLRLS